MKVGWDLKLFIWISGEKTGREEDSGDPGEAVPGPDRAHHDGEGGPEVRPHPRQERARGDGVQEAQQGEVLRRGEDSRAVPDREDIPEGEIVNLNIAAWVHVDIWHTEYWSYCPNHSS